MGSLLEVRDGVVRPNLAVLKRMCDFQSRLCIRKRKSEEEGNKEAPRATLSTGGRLDPGQGRDLSPCRWMVPFDECVLNWFQQTRQVPLPLVGLCFFILLFETLSVLFKWI